MTEVEYVISNFPKWFAGFLDCRIVLHGSRNYAEAIIDKYGDTFNFVGVMSLDPIGSEYFHGLKVLHEEDIPVLDVDVVILTERVKYAVNAFYSIRHICKSNNIKVYNMYGLNEFLVHYEAEKTEDLSLEKAKKKCEAYDIIAFEVINTVLYSPQGVSSILVRKLFYELIEFLHKQKKEVRFSLRKSYPEEIQIDELKAFGLLHNHNEIIRRKGEDLSFRTLKESNPGKKILYFGSGLANEFILPRCYGIDTCRFVVTYNPTDLISRPRNTENSSLFNTDLRKKIENEILRKQLISFDIFDTLLLRKTLYPQDIFCLIEQKAVLAGYKAEGFVSARVQAEDSQAFCNIYQIYDWLQNYFGWSRETTQKIQNIEIETERENLTLRTEVAELLSFAKNEGKRIVLTSDMYLPESIIRGILTENGIDGYEGLLVSCDVKKSKHTGLYKELINYCDNINNIIHIGDNPVADGYDCKAFGIKNILIPSAFEMARNKGWDKCIQTASTLMERCLLGLIISKIFRNPFQNPNYVEESTKNQLWRFGLCTIAPLAVGHMTWMIRKLQDEMFAGVLFFARDGWLSFNIYNIIRKRFNLPRGIYYYANRKAASQCHIDLPQVISQLIDLGIMSGLNAEDILINVFQVPKQDLSPNDEGEATLSYIEKHMGRIHKNAVEARKGYLRYSERCSMQKGNSYAVVDFVTVGTVQNYLSQVLPFEFKGLNFGCYSPASLANDKIDYYLRGENSLLLKRYVEVEPFFSSPEPSQKCVNERGEPVFDKERRTFQELQEVKYVWDIVLSFAEEFFESFYKKGEVISSSIVEEVYAVEDYYVNHHSVFNEWLGVPYM